MRGFAPPSRARARLLRALVFVLAVTLPATAHAATPAQQIAALNAQRTANGIPAGIAERPAWSEGCRRHMAYIAANGGTLTHEEQSGRPGYSPEGAAIARRSVLTPLAEAFNSDGNAFEFAPLHLMQTLAPALSQMGVSGGCATTNLGYDRRAFRPALYTYPGNEATDVYASEQAFELPFVPGDFVGLPQGATTGPHIYVMTLGTGPGRIAGAGLSGPAGPVEVRTVDNETPRLEGYMPPGGIIIPVSPLAGGAQYTVSAVFQPSAGGAPLARSWTFRTRRPAPPLGLTQGSSAVDAGTPATPARLALSNPRPSPRWVTFTLSADPALVGQRARISIVRIAHHCGGRVCRDRQQGRTLHSVIGRLASSQPISAPRPARGRTLRVEVQTLPFDSAGVSYGASSAFVRWSSG